MRPILLPTLLGIIFGCNSGGGPDSLPLDQHLSLNSSTCLICHSSQDSLDPLVTNGSGTAGKHSLHVTIRRIDCLKCHLHYRDQPTHMDGTNDRDSSLVMLVDFDTTNPNGRWVNDSGSRTGACSSLACHGPETPDWYSPGEVLPDCSVCHVGPFDPLLTNGSGTAGKHVLHVSRRSLGCPKCHQNYSNQLTHMNGTVDTANSNVRLVYFDGANAGGQWINDGGSQTGNCSSLSCHGAETPAWYRAGESLPDCTICHAGAYDPLLTNGSGTAGKHGVHVTDYSMSCGMCHYGYTDYPTHMNGTVDTSNPAVRLVFFNSLNGGAGWINDTGPQTGNCENTYCHSNSTGGTQNIGGISKSSTLNAINDPRPVATNTSPLWYATGSLDCTACHGYPPSYNNIGGPKANSHDSHIAAECIICHSDTMADAGQSIDAAKGKHMNGIYDVVPGSSSRWVAVSFTYRFDAGGGQCSSVSCHGAGSLPKVWGNEQQSVYMSLGMGATCYQVNLTAQNSSGGTVAGPPPYLYEWDFGDNTYESGSTGSLPLAVSHTYAGPGDYMVTFNFRDGNYHVGTRMIPVSLSPVNAYPVGAGSASVSGYTVTLIDRSYDPDYNICGHSGPGTITIDWNDGTTTVAQINLTDQPSNQQFSHTYSTGGWYFIRSSVTDNAGRQAGAGLGWHSVPQ